MLLLVDAVFSFRQLVLDLVSAIASLLDGILDLALGHALLLCLVCKFVVLPCGAQCPVLIAHACCRCHFEPPLV